MNIQEAVKAIQQNGGAMRRTCWLTTRIKIAECGELDTQTRKCKGCYSQPCEFGECTALVDERGKLWKPNIEELAATDWVVCNKVDDRVADARAKESERRMARDRIEQTARLEECHRLNIIALITAGAALLINAARAIFGF